MEGAAREDESKYLIYGSNKYEKHTCAESMHPVTITWNPDALSFSTPEVDSRTLLSVLYIHKMQYN